MIWPKSLLVAAGLFVRLATAQDAGWQANQVNSTICSWDSPRAAVIRDTFYIDGGLITWMAGMADGTVNGPHGDDNPLGIVYQLNFSRPFNTTGDFNFSSAFITNLTKAAGGGNANNIGPQYYDGAMFANDYDWITYGGLFKNTSAYVPQPETQVATYQRYPNGPRTFASGFTLKQLPTGVTRYITNGASVSIPSENLGFYFGGLRSPSSGAIFYQPGASNSAYRANVQSTTLISVDLSDQVNEAWSNDTLPTTVPGRANAELVWVPVGKRGVLVAIGGVIYPSFATSANKNNASIEAQSKAVSPGFMTTIPVYDIDTKTWYQQNTTGPPPGQLTQGCTVLASAQDGSSHNIYWYGGFNGLTPTGDFSDDVWVLSIPTFAWVKVKSGTNSHGRAGHRCAKPYPDQMIVVGGYTTQTGVSGTCIDGFIQILNLTTAEWITSYHPDKWSNYGVPASVVSVIGGSPTGSASQTAPSPSGFSNTSMTALFGTKYNTSKIATWYPYHVAPTSDGTRPSLLPSAVPKPDTNNGTPKYLAPVLGVVLGLIFLSLLALAIFLWKRKKYFKPNGTATQSEAETLDNRRWVANWLRNSTPASAEAKAPTVTTDDTHVSPDYEQEHAYLPEVEGVQIVEMADTSRPTELHDTGFVAIPSSRSNGAHRSNSHISHTSSVSRESNGSNIRPSISPVPSPRADSPPIGAPIGELPDRQRGLSGISNVSEGERGHLRGISETSVSTDGGVYATPMGIPELEERGVSPNPIVEEPTSIGEHRGGDVEARPNVVSPLTPPTAIRDSGDYMGGGAAGAAGAAAMGSSSSRLGVRGSPKPDGNRKSMFEEKLDDDK